MQEFSKIFLGEIQFSNIIAIIKNLMNPKRAAYKPATGIGHRKLGLPDYSPPPMYNSLNPFLIINLPVAVKLHNIARSVIVIGRKHRPSRLII